MLCGKDEKCFPQNLGKYSEHFIAVQALRKFAEKIEGQ
jgi:hypothetical protein